MDSKTYMWPREGNETPMVGRKVLSISGMYITSGDCVLMQPLYSTACVWIVESKLTEYIGGRGT